MLWDFDGIEAEIIEAERFHESVANGFTHNPDGSIVVGKDFDASLYLKGLLKTVKRIQASIEDVSVIVESVRAQPSIRFNRPGLDLYLACSQFRSKICHVVDGELKPLYQGRRLHPYLAIALPVIAEYEERIQRASYEDHGLLHQYMSEMVNAIRMQCVSRNVTKQVKNFSRGAHAKLARALRYALGLFKKRSRLLILRVDLYVRAGSREWGYGEEADDAFEKFVDALARSEIVPDVIGWMIAREDGIERGQHYHVLAAIDGHEHRAGASLAKLLGEYWVRDCVGSSQIGSYFNCFALVKKYRHLGIGMVRCDDARKLLGLYHAIRYLCKDEVMLLPKSKRPRNFRRGVDDRNYVRSGAPRSNDDGLALARGILLGRRPRKRDTSLNDHSREYRYKCRW